MSHLKGLFYTGLVLDDVVFKLHYGFTTYLLLFMFVLITSKLFLGDPIHCTMATYEFDKFVSRDMLNTYCYIHSTFIYPQSLPEGEDDLYSYYGVQPSNDVVNVQPVFRSYYQWVSLVLLVQGLMFYLSHLYWIQFENGTMRSLKLGLDNPSQEVKKQSEQIRRLVQYFRLNTNRHNRYGNTYLGCVLFNAVNMSLQIWFLDFVLGGQATFVTYGYRFFISGPPGYQDQVFPKMSKCNLYIYGPSGTRQNLDALCVLPLNILYDKVFLVVWVWYLILFLLSWTAVFYWAVQYKFPMRRLMHLESHLLGGTLGGNRLRNYNKTFGDWFVLHQLYKNIHNNNFFQLVSKLSATDGTSTPMRRSETNIQFPLSVVNFDLDNEEVEEHPERIHLNKRGP